MTIQPVERIFLHDPRVKPQTVRHHVARYRFALSKAQKNMDYLDIGCGTGYGCNFFSQLGCNTTGFDVSEDAINFCKSSNKDTNWLVQDICCWQPTGKYDIITLFEVIEHLPLSDAEELFEKVKQSLKSGGRFFVSTPRIANFSNNEWHISEWSYDMLIEKLSNVFAKVSLFGQDWDTANITENNVREEDFYIAVCQ